LYFDDVCCIVPVNVTPQKIKGSRRRKRDTGAGAATTHWVFQGLVLLAATALMANVLVGDQGLIATLRARHQYEELAAGIARQRAENTRLREEARRLREDPSAIEELARRDLGLIRPGEKVFILKDLPSAPKPHTP